MKPLIRTITLGIPVDPLALRRSEPVLNDFLYKSRFLLDKYEIGARSLRVTCQPMDWLFDSQVTTDRVVKLGQAVDEMLEGEAWFCLPGPQFRHENQLPHRLEAIPKLIESTRNVFTNTLVSSENGIHRSAIRHAAMIIKELSSLDEKLNANFRFAVMANVKANTPFFPASYHKGAAGFSISLELAEMMNECFDSDESTDSKLSRFRNELNSSISPIVKLAEELSVSAGLEFKGFDFSLAPYPGERSSAIKAVELLNNSKFGSFDFLFSLFAVNNTLKSSFSHFPQVGYNGSMLSILEDSHLAQHCDKGLVDPKDLLLYANVCGCGLDMVPLPESTSVSKLSSLIEATSSIASKWNKPLIARLLPCKVDEKGKSMFKHDFIVNTKPISLDENKFSKVDVSEIYFTPATPQRVTRNHDDNLIES